MYWYLGERRNITLEISSAFKQSFNFGVVWGEKESDNHDFWKISLFFDIYMIYVQAHTYMHLRLCIYGFLVSSEFFKSLIYVHYYFSVETMYLHMNRYDKTKQAII